MPDPYRTLSVETDAGVARVTLAHPPVNLLDVALLGELHRLVGELEANRRRSGWWCCAAPIPSSSSRTPTWR